jgi:hypothetical protein
MRPILFAAVPLVPVLLAESLAACGAGGLGRLASPMSRARAGAVGTDLVVPSAMRLPANSAHFAPDGS